MVQRLVALLRRGDRDLQVGLELFLTDKLGQVLWTQAQVKRLVLRGGYPRYDALLLYDGLPEA